MTFRDVRSSLKLGSLKTPLSEVSSGGQFHKPFPLRLVVTVETWDDSSLS